MPVSPKSANSTNGPIIDVDLALHNDTPCSWDYASAMRGGVTERNERFAASHVETGDYATETRKGKY